MLPRTQHAVIECPTYCLLHPGHPFFLKLFHLYPKNCPKECTDAAAKAVVEVGSSKSSSSASASATTSITVDKSSKGGSVDVSVQKSGRRL